MFDLSIWRRGELNGEAVLASKSQGEVDWNPGACIVVTRFGGRSWYSGHAIRTSCSARFVNKCNSSNCPVQTVPIEAAIQNTGALAENQLLYARRDVKCPAHIGWLDYRHRLPY